MSFRDKLGRVVKRHQELSALLAAGGHKDAQEFARLSKEYSDLDPLVAAILDLQKADKEMGDLAAMAEDPAADKEMKALAETELAELKQRVPGLEQQVKVMLLPKDEADARNAILEVRAGTGGEEAALFAANLRKSNK